MELAGSKNMLEGAQCRMCGCGLDEQVVQPQCHIYYLKRPFACNLKAHVHQREIPGPIPSCSVRVSSSDKILVGKRDN